VISARYAVELRRELCARNLSFAKSSGLAHVLSYGEMPVIVYAPEAAGTRHGNFFDLSYTAILKRPEWARRLEKIHAQGRRALPRAVRAWRELDSSMSSDALLMNVFCCPRVCSSKAVASLLGTEPGDAPEFGYKARVPLRGGKRDRTEVDMKLGSLLVEAKLTENDFQIKKASVLESYRDFGTVFEISALPQSGDQYISYQLIRNTLAAHSAGLTFCVITDARRPDLLEAWHSIMRCIRHSELRTRCKVLTWQELNTALPCKLQSFLEAKYGILASGGKKQLLT
jgi:hypothetical protein